MPNGFASLPAPGIITPAIAPAAAYGYASQEWSPAFQPGLELWLDGRTGVLNAVSPDVPATNGQTVRRWVNRDNPGTYDADQTTGAYQPLYDAPAKSLVFDGVNDRIRSVINITGNDFCFVARVNISSVLGVNDGSIGRIISVQANASTQDFNNPISIALLLLFGGNVGTFQNGGLKTSLAYPADTYCTLICNSSPAGYQLYVNNTVSSVSAISALASNYIDIGGSLAGGLPYANFHGDYKEILYYSSARTPAQIAQLQAWAATL